MKRLVKFQCILFFAVATVFAAYGQSDTMNRVDKFGKKFGSWEKYDGKTLLWKGRFYNGEPVGEFVYYHKNKQIERKLNYFPNSPKVSCVSFHSNGVKSSEGIFINKQKDGKWLYYNDNGHLIAEENYDKGKKHGKFKLFTGKEAVLLEEETWNNNLKDGAYRAYYITGALRIKMSYAKGKMHGDFENYYEDSTLWNKGQYKDNFRNGTWTCYNRAGKEIKVEEIDMGIVKQTRIGVETTGKQWLKIDIEQIAYIYDEGELVLQLKNKKKIPLSDNNSLTAIATTAGHEYFIRINERMLASFDAIRKVTPINKEEAKVLLHPQPPFEVLTYDNFYEALKSFINPNPPKD